jgi:2-oxoglutarate dehydrogenase E1 component
MSSSPRLMMGQGAIIAAGAIDYPAEYLGAADETRAMLGISKVMTLPAPTTTASYRERNPALFLGRVQALTAMTGSTKRCSTTCACRTCRYAGRPIASRPARHERRAVRRIAKEAGIMQMIGAYACAAT